MNIWCRIFGWDKKQWKEIVRTYGIHFTLKGHRYVIKPLTLLHSLIYVIFGFLGAASIYALYIIMCVLFG